MTLPGGPIGGPSNASRGRRRPLFRPRHRLSRSLDYRAVFDARLKTSRGPLTVFVLPNDLGHPRLGLSVGRRVGNAVRRNAVKRRLREAFRHLAADWPEPWPGLDIVVTVRAHRAMSALAYAELLRPALQRLARLAEQRREGKA